MAKTRNSMIMDILKTHPDQALTSREIANEMVQAFAEELKSKRQNPRFENDAAFIQQIVREISGNKSIENLPQIQILDDPKPRRYRWVSTVSLSDPPASEEEHTEHELYPLLMDYLHRAHQLYCLRIDEKRSKNTRGHRGNHWLHPDIVGIDARDLYWHSDVRDCVRAGPGRTVKLWSFEVKKSLSKHNVRECYFQTVSNSSWANLGYLVTAEIKGDHQDTVQRELQMLSALHGIGVMVLNPTDVYDSYILIPARERSQVGWDFVNRIVEENDDFKQFINKVEIYYKTGKITAEEWNR